MFWAVLEGSFLAGLPQPCFPFASDLRPKRRLAAARIHTELRSGSRVHLHIDVQSKSAFRTALMAQAQGTSKALAIPSDSTAAPQRRSSSLPIPVDDTLNVEEQAAAASLRARDSDSDWRAFLFWQRMGKPPALDPRTSTSTRSDAARSGRRSPSPRSVAFDVVNNGLDGEDVLFALDP